LTQREAVAQKIREGLPELRGIADILPRTRSDLFAFLTLILTAIALLIQSGSGTHTTTNVTVNQVINQVCIESEKSAKRQPNQQFAKKKQEVLKKKIGRNDPCPCCSGKKYKNCCGKPK
jgi:uncharacterized protein YecA (UPF0149 family)